MGTGQHAIFIGYRRDDTADASGRVYDRLRNAFGPDAVFKDVDNLPVGRKFGEHILTILPKCRVFLAMIGPRWIDVRNEVGVRRLEDSEDWVRIELETALTTPDLQVVPVLINGASMPRLDQLPASLRALPELHGAIVRRDPDFHRDMDRLIAALEAGVRTGTVTVQAPIGTASGTPAQNWSRIENSLDVRDYSDFIEVFPSAPEVFEARRHKRQLEDWSAVQHDDPDAIAAFRKTLAFEGLHQESERILLAAQNARRQAAELAEKERATKAVEDAKEAASRRQKREQEKIEIAALRSRANEGDIDAQFALAMALNDSYRDKKNSETIVWLESAAKGGHAKAQFELAEILQRGRGRTEVNVSKAKSFYRMAASKGHLEALLRAEYLGYLDDDIEAVRWFREGIKNVKDEDDKQLNNAKRSLDKLNKNGALRRWRVLPIFFLVDVIAVTCVIALVGLLSSENLPPLSDEKTILHSIVDVFTSISWRLGPVAVTPTEVALGGALSLLGYFVATVEFYDYIDSNDILNRIALIFVPVAVAGIAFLVSYFIATLLPANLTPWVLGLASVGSLGWVIGRSVPRYFGKRNDRRARLVRLAVILGAFSSAMLFLTFRL